MQKCLVNQDSIKGVRKNGKNESKRKNGVRGKEIKTKSADQASAGADLSVYCIVCADYSASFSPCNRRILCDEKELTERAFS